MHARQSNRSRLALTGAAMAALLLCTACGADPADPSPAAERDIPEHCDTPYRLASENELLVIVDEEEEQDLASALDRYDPETVMDNYTLRLFRFEVVDLVELCAIRDDLKGQGFSAQYNYADVEPTGPGEG